MRLLTIDRKRVDDLGLTEDDGFLNNCALHEEGTFATASADDATIGPWMSKPRRPSSSHRVERDSLRCERCAFTSRCYAFDWQAAFERSRADGGDPLKALQQLLSTDRTKSTVSAADLAEVSRRERARDARVEASKIMRLAVEYHECSTAWVDDRRERVAARADSSLVEAFETIGP